MPLTTQTFIFILFSFYLIWRSLSKHLQGQYLSYIYSTCMYSLNLIAYLRQNSIQIWDVLSSWVITGFVLLLQVNLETSIPRSWLIVLMYQSFDLYLIRSGLLHQILKLILLISSSSCCVSNIHYCLWFQDCKLTIPSAFTTGWKFAVSLKTIVTYYYCFISYIWLGLNCSTVHTN